jgi:hypothetical protein
MKIGALGMLVELDNIPFKVGTVLSCQIQFSETNVYTEKIRSIKHYDKYYRTPPKKKKSNAQSEDKIQEDNAEPQPKKLCEFHFVKILESTRVAIQKYMYTQKILAERKR